MASMHIEVDYSGRGATCSVLKWIAFGVALHVALHVLVVFVRTKLLSNYLLIFCVADGCWLDNRGNEGACECTTTDYKGEANAVTL